MTYLDKDPEDVYDAGDPANIRLDVLERVVAALRAHPADGRLEARRVDALRIVDNLEAELGVDRVRLWEIRDALEELDDG
jgi:hypothetical protein